jgi:hypothetical protein
VPFIWPEVVPVGAVTAGAFVAATVVAAVVPEPPAPDVACPSSPHAIQVATGRRQKPNQTFFDMRAAYLKPVQVEP